MSEITTPDEEVAEVRRMLRDSARDFARSRLEPGRLRQPRDAAHDAWSEMAQLGWTGLMVDGAHGGSGLGISEMAVVLEELGRVAAPEPLAPCAVLAARVIALSDQLPLRDDLLAGIAGGSLLPAVAWQENARLRDEAACTTRAEEAAGGWRLQGAKCFVRPGAPWSGIIVPAQAADGVALFWVPAGTAGLEARPLKLSDGSTAMDVTLADVRVGPEQLLASPAVAARALAEGLDFARLAAAAELLGVVRGVLALAFDHLRTREQFGVAIGTFQALRHRAVDLYLQQELVSAALEEACSAADAGPPADLPMRAARVKARASAAALAAAKEATQIHGAMGYTDECDVGLYLKRALALAAWLGNASELRALHARDCLVPQSPSTGATA